MGRPRLYRYPIFKVNGRDINLAFSFIESKYPYVSLVFDYLVFQAKLVGELNESTLGLIVSGIKQIRQDLKNDPHAAAVKYTNDDASLKNEMSVAQRLTRDITQRLGKELFGSFNADDPQDQARLNRRIRELENKINYALEYMMAQPS